MTPLQIAFAIIMFTSVVLIPVALDQLRKRQQITTPQIAIVAVIAFMLTRYIAFVL